MSARGVEWLAQRVRELREERGVSRAELAEASGLELEVVAAVEAGEISADLTTLRRLAKGFGLLLSELFEGLGGPNDGFSLGARLRACRRAQSLALAELAAKAKLEPDQLERIETDQHRPDLAQLRALAAALGKSVADLLGKM